MLLCKNRDVTVDFLEQIFKKYPKKIRNIGKLNKNGKNALHYAADGCNIEIIDFLANKGVDTTAVMSEGTPLMLLVKNIVQKQLSITDDFIKNFNKLIKNKNIQKSINVVNNDKENILYIALYNYCDIQIIKILTENNVNIKQENANKVTPFMLLCKRNDIDAEYLKELIEKNNITKKDINRIDDFGNSVLSTIVRNVNKNKLNILKLLIDKGADINIKNTDGKTVFDIAKEQNDTELIEFFDSVKNNLEKHHKNTTTNNSITINNSKNEKHTASVSLTEEVFPDLKPAVEKTATSFISKKQTIVQEKQQNEVQNAKDTQNNEEQHIKNDNFNTQETERRNIEEEKQGMVMQNINKKTQVVVKDTKEEKQNEEQITDNLQDNKKQTSNNSAVKKQNTDNDLVFMFCLMFILLNRKNILFNNLINTNKSFSSNNSLMF